MAGLSDFWFCLFNVGPEADSKLVKGMVGIKQITNGPSAHLQRQDHHFVHRRLESHRPKGDFSCIPPAAHCPPLPASKGNSLEIFPHGHARKFSVHWASLSPIVLRCALWLLWLLWLLTSQSQWDHNVTSHWIVACPHNWMETHRVRSPKANRSKQAANETSSSLNDWFRKLTLCRILRYWRIREGWNLVSFHPEISG